MSGQGSQAEIGRDTPIYRLIPTDQCTAVDGQWEFNSSAFDNSSEPGFEDEMSVVLGDTLADLEREPQDLPARAYPAEPHRWGVAVVAASTLIDEEQELRRTPTEAEPAHGDAVGAKGAKRRKRIKRAAAWVARPRAPIES